MKLKKIYEVAVQEGIQADPRDKKSIEEVLKKNKEHFQKLCDMDKEYFDKEQWMNPYADTRILVGDPGKNIKTALVGIDIDTAELLLADRINTAKKEKIDLVISHHPQGFAYASFYEVMDMQAEIFESAGVPINIAEKLVEERKSEVSRKIHASNHEKTTDAARLLKLAFLCIHTPADNHAANFLQKRVDQKKPKTLKDVLGILESIEEYQLAKKQKSGPQILLGNSSSRVGKIFIDMTGGTEGPKKIFDKLATAGIGTLIGMHFSEEHYKELKDKNINVVVAGHCASDNLGMNLLLDKIVRVEKIKIIPCSGFRRVKR